MARKIKYSDQQLMDNIKLVGQDFEYAPTEEEFRQHPLHIADPTTIVKRLGPWVPLCVKIGLRPSIMQLSSSVSKKYIKDEYIKEAYLNEIYQAMIAHPEENLSQLPKKYMHNGSNILRFFKSTEELSNALYKKYGIRAILNQYKEIEWIKDLLKEEFYRIKNLLQKKPTLQEMMTYSEYKGIQRGIRKEYGTYANFCYSLGYDFRARKRTPEVVEQKKVLYIQRLRKAVYKAKRMGIEPTGYQYKEMCGTADRTIIELFGSVENWFKEAGVKEPKTLRQFRYKTDEEIFSFIRKLARKLKRPPTAIEYEACQDKPVSRRLLCQRFGSWNNARILAGLKIKAITSEDIIQSLKRVKRDLKHIPTIQEYMEHKFRICCDATVRKHFGSWPNALEAAGLKEKSAS